MIITRKIQIYINTDDKDDKNDAYSRLRHWFYQCYRLANIVASHKFIQDNIKDFMYLTEGIKVKLADAERDPEGMLNISELNSTYRVASAKTKGEIPMAIASALNSVLVKTYRKEKKEYYAGIRSLRNYKHGFPMPVPKTLFYDFVKDEDGRNYTFNLLKTKGVALPFKTHLGADRSNNGLIIERMLSGIYKMADSSIMYDIKKNKYFLLLCVHIPNRTQDDIKTDKSIDARLDVDMPIVIRIGKTEFAIGNREEYLYRRLRIQAALRNLQKDLKYSNSGKGRKHKLDAIERFRKKEKNYIKTKLHKYSSELVKIAIKRKCGQINLLDLQEKSEEAKEEKNKFLLRNWNYYGLRTLIEYKAAREGIKVNVL